MTEQDAKPSPTKPIPPQPWRDSLRVYKDPRAITMGFLGFSAGLPLLLIFSSLSLWLREAGVDRATVTFFSWAALGYSFKFVWAPLVDVLPLPGLTRAFGRRRSWLLLSQSMIVMSIVAMALTNPAAGSSALTIMALAAVALGFSSATQDIVIDAYRIESAPDSLQAALSATYIAGYRVALIVAGAGALFIAEGLGSSMQTYDYAAWRWAYLFMALMMGIGMITTLVRPEPKVSQTRAHQYTSQHYGRFFLLFCVMALGFICTFVATQSLTAYLRSPEALGSGAVINVLISGARLLLAFSISAIIAVVGIKTQCVDRTMVIRSYLHPIKNFFDRYDTKAAVLLLALIGTYRISDIILGVIANVFYQDLGFSKQQIATVVKSYGLGMTLIGGIVGGALVKQLGLMRMLLWGAILSAGTNLLFMSLAAMGQNVAMLYLVISADNLAAGLASAAFVAFLSSLTDISFTAIQYAIFSSLMTLLPKTLGGYSGTMVNAMGYEHFFLMTALIGVPVLWVVWRCGKLAEPSKPPTPE